MTAPLFNKNNGYGLVVHPGGLSKRAFDILASALGMALLSPVFAVIAIYIKHYSSGPVFYRGLRSGREGKQFNILKFRTMYETPESYAGPRITASDDPRITPVGRWLRDTKLNELPQLWNVLKGEMSLVGPRPEDPQVVGTWPADVRQEIHSVRPGITSSASIFFRDEESLLQSVSVMDKYLSSVQPSKLRLDQLYVREHSFLGDLDIIFLTLIAMLPKLRKREFPEHLILWGPLSRLISRHVNWFLFDVLIAFVALAISGLLSRSAGPLDLGWDTAALAAVVIALLYGFVNTLLGLNRIAWSQARASDAWSLAASGALTALLLITFERTAPGWDPLPIGMWVLASLLSILGFVAARYRFRLLTGLASRWLDWRGVATQMGERVLIIGAGQMNQFTIQLLRESSVRKALRIVGMVDDDPRLRGLYINGYKVLGTTRELPHLVARWNIGLLLYSIDNLPPEQCRAILARFRQTETRLVCVPDIYELFSACLLASEVDEAGGLVSPNWNGSVPIPVVVNWLMELEALARPENAPLLARLQQVRNALTVHLVNEQHE